MCSDALEGLMHSDLEQSKLHLNEMKSEFEKKLSEIKPTEKTKTGSTLTSNKSAKPSASPTSLKPVQGSKFRWAYAASVLLIIGLGYSVFSFIKEYNQKADLASNKENPKFTSAEKPYTPMQDSSGELVRLEASAEDIEELCPNAKESKNTVS